VVKADSVNKKTGNDKESVPDSASKNSII